MLTEYIPSDHFKEKAILMPYSLRRRPLRNGDLSTPAGLGGDYIMPAKHNDSSEYWLFTLLREEQMRQFEVEIIMYDHCGKEVYRDKKGYRQRLCTRKFRRGSTCPLPKRIQGVFQRLR